MWMVSPTAEAPLDLSSGFGRWEHQLADGSKLDLGWERFHLPEQLFTPTVLSAAPPPAGCAPAPGAATSQVRYTGKACGGGGGAAGAPILWSGMETLDPRAGTSVCSWTAASEPAGWRDEWTGGCGVGPSRLPTLPDHLCPP
mgnify:CR=1 FL=1